MVPKIPSAISPFAASVSMSFIVPMVEKISAAWEELKEAQFKAEVIWFLWSVVRGPAAAQATMRRLTVTPAIQPVLVAYTVVSLAPSL